MDHMSKPKTIFVTVQVTLSDPDQWAATYGVEGSDSIKKDVKEFIVNTARDALTESGEITAEVTGW